MKEESMVVVGVSEPKDVLCREPMLKKTYF